MRLKTFHLLFLLSKYYLAAFQAKNRCLNATLTSHLQVLPEFFAQRAARHYESRQMHIVPLVGGYSCKYRALRPCENVGEILLIDYLSSQFAMLHQTPNSSPI
ncbi:hypothetical protein BJ912DRAFT_960536 [Pholiota molesta]|nr:hypothetical protein BJ912DRAFT_960536 [Pholiota molesta]